MARLRYATIAAYARYAVIDFAAFSRHAAIFAASAVWRAAEQRHVQVAVTTSASQQ